ncbi:MAG: Holliday junction branch migration protein RuvA [Lachnospiraceae bacterium]|nr:Holliday junction branch migration protein RuvA [Lachnospiraceae bacterium]
MYAYIKGTVEAVKSDHVIVECGGIGYRIFVPASYPDQLRIGDEVKLHTFFSVREDAMQLFGFLTEDDLEIYRLLLTVSGVGPKGALGILSVLNADDLRFAVLSDDSTSIAKAPGIGKKTAQKVIIELKDKLSLTDAFEKKAEHVAAAKYGPSPDMDAAEALTALGYSKAEALKAVRAAAALNPEADTEGLIRAALRTL